MPTHTHPAQTHADRTLSTYFKWKECPRIRPGLEDGLFAPHWDELATFFAHQGYSWYVIRRVIEIAKPLARYAETVGVHNLSGLDGRVIQGYLKARPRSENRCCIQLLRRFGRDRGLLPDTVASPSTGDGRDPGGVLSEYLRFLHDHRGTGERTVARHRPHVDALLRDLGAQGGPGELHRLTGRRIQTFIMTRASGLGRAERKALCAAIRTFLRFAYLRGYTARALVSAVPVIPQFKLERLPTAISTEAIERILAAVDRTTPLGRRDYAMLLVLATYGIRAGQLCALRLDDLDWRRQVLRVPGAKGGCDSVYPLHPAVGEALVDYLRQGRPVGWAYRQVFLRVRAPIRPLRGVLTNHIKPYARKAGVQPPSLGSHAWRHAAATRMLAHGQSLKTIRHLLGHRSIETTFIYTKVDVGALREAALEWPEVQP